MALEVLRELHRRKQTGEGTMALEALRERMARYRLDEHLETVTTERFERPRSLHPDAPEDAPSGRRAEVLARAAVAQAQRCPKCVEGRAYELHFPDGVTKTVCAFCSYGWEGP
jgi:hypothetical protein